MSAVSDDSSHPPTSGPVSFNSRPVRLDTLQPGYVVCGKYLIDRIIGTGGVGVVVAARHLELDETVAIKFLRPEVQNKPEIVARFSREAKAAVRIKSEHAARIYDVGVAPGRGPYLLMEYLQGRDVATVLRENGPMPPRRAVEYTLQACEALAVAHANGIIHRDVKPENLFLAQRPDGTEIIKVLDFGISKAALTGEVFPSEAPLIKTQNLMGSPLYMSPEQTRSTANVDARTDIWSLGIVLFELLTGRAPLEGDTITEICAAVLEGTPAPLSKYMPEVPEGLQSVVDNCLQKDPARRFQSVAELAVALVPFAPSGARVLAERATSTLRASGQAPGVDFRHQSSVPPPPPSARVSVRTPGVILPVAEMATHLEIPAQPARGRTRAAPLIAIASGLVVLLAVGAGFFAVRSSRQAPVASGEVATHPVAIESDPPGARVEWDGKLLGETPVTTRLPAGVQTLKLSKEGFEGENLVITSAGNDEQTRPLRVTMRKLSAPPPIASAAPAPAPAPFRPRASAVPSSRYTAFGSARPYGARPPGVLASSTAPPPFVGLAPPPPPASTPPATAPATAPASATSPPPKVRLVDDDTRVRILDDEAPPRSTKAPLVP